MFLMFMSRLDIVLKLSKFYSTTPVSVLLNNTCFCFISSLNEGKSFCFLLFFGTIENNNTGYTLLFSILSKFVLLLWLSGVDPGFQVWHLNKLRRAEGGAKIFEVFHVKNHDFTPKNHIFSNFREGARRVRPLDPPLVSTYNDDQTEKPMRGS